MGAMARESGLSPHEVYSERRAARDALAARHRQRERAISWARGSVFLTGVGLAWLVFYVKSVAFGWLAAPAAVFLVLLFVHERVIRARKLAERAVAFYERGLACLEDRWMRGGVSGEAHVSRDHPYAADLDVFGEGSLFERLASARTSSGEATLAAWLAAPALAAEARDRQRACAELAPRLELREELALLGEELRSGLEPGKLVAWGARPVAARLAAKRLLALGAALGLVSGLGLTLAGLGLAPLFLGLLLAGSAVALVRRDVERALDGMDRAVRDLTLVAELLRRIERESFEAPRLVALRRALERDGEPPSRSIAELVKLVDLRDARLNQLFAPFAVLLLWGTQLGLAIEAWRARHGGSLGLWLQCVGELEALIALAAYRYERPADVFPELLEELSPPGEEGASGALAPVALLDAEGLGHPLLPERVRVRNDIELGRAHRLHVVSGSNMSGKSTWLRTIGINVVLAQAGAPVCARRMRLAPLTVGASIRIQDSLQGGVSRFYAEIQRLARIVELAAPGAGPEARPLLFLLDEVLAGTNSHDRRIGAEAVVRRLVELGAIGLVTTHDLALAEIVGSLDGRARNVHFEDRIVDGRIEFDYKLREGVVRRSNALELMRSLKLPV